MKRGHRVKNWKNRFVTIVGSSLMYRTDEDAGTLKGTVDLRGATVRTLDAGTFKKRPNAFQITPAAGKPLICSTVVAADQRRWVRAVRLVAPLDPDHTSQVAEVVMKAQARRAAAADAAASSSARRVLSGWR